MKNIDFRINLNHLSTLEYMRNRDTYEEYQEAVVAMLSKKDEFTFEEDIKEQYKDDDYVNNLIKKDKPFLEAVLRISPNRFVSAGRRPKKKGDKELHKAWFDTAKRGRTITPDDFLYDLFFVYHLRHQDILEMDSLLDFFLEKYYERNVQEFTRFLKLALRKHCKKLLEAEQIETINEWISEKEKEQSLSGVENAKPKGKVKRERDDKITQLNQEQTALLIYCLRETKIILKDEYLNNKEAGLAFSILTGYSQETLRQNITKTEQTRISSRKNNEVVKKVLRDVIRFIENQMEPEE